MSSTTHFRNLVQNLPVPSETLAILLGLAELTIFGVAGLANPQEFAKAYGLPFQLSSSSAGLLKSDARALEDGPSTTKVDDAADKALRNQKALVAAITARNIQNGVLLLALACYARDRRALGIAVVASFIPTFMDAFIVKAYGTAEQVWGHVFGMVNTASIGLGLLYWGREDSWW